jgi:CxxC-x17-CxxC domain-containing protein
MIESMTDFSVGNCAICHKKTTVPFQKAKGRPIYCRDCWQKIKRQRTRAASVDSESLNFNHGFNHVEKGMWKNPRNSAYKTRETEQKSTTGNF